MNIAGTSAQYLWDNTISGTAFTNIKNSFKTAYVWVRVYVWCDNYTSSVAAYVNWGRSYELAATSADPGEGYADTGSYTVTLSSATQLRTYIFGRCNMNGGHGWIEGSIQIRFDK